MQMHTELGDELPLDGVAYSYSSEQNTIVTATATGGVTETATQVGSTSEEFVNVGCSGSGMSVSSVSVDMAGAGGDSSSFTSQDGISSFTISSERNFDKASLRVENGFTSTVNNALLQLGQSSGSTSSSSSVGVTANVTTSMASNATTTHTSTTQVVITNSTSDMVTTASVTSTTFASDGGEILTYTDTTYAETVTTSSEATVTTSRLTVSSTTETTWSLTSTNTTQTYPATTSLSTDEFGSSEVPYTTTVERTTTTVSSVSSEISSNQNCRAIESVYEAEACAVLYVGGPVEGGLVDSCAVWSSAEQVRVSPTNFSTTSSTAASGGPSSASAGTTWSYTHDTSTESTYPELFSPQGFEIRAPFPESGGGFQPHTALGTDDPVYVTYTIDVHTSVTDAVQQALRSVGTTYIRTNITQVLAHSDDTFQPGATRNTAGQVSPHGGYGASPGANSVTYSAGIYAVTYIDIGAGTTTSRFTVQPGDTLSSAFARGLGLAVDQVDGYVGGAGWTPGYEEKAVQEILCENL